MSALAQAARSPRREPEPAADAAPVRVLHVCDKLGIAGSTTHGVARLMSWWLPRFDRRRYLAELVCLRDRDASGELIERSGASVGYLAKGKFDPSTLTALRHMVRQREVGLLHLHGYGAGTFGRIVGRLTGTPVVLHEHFVDPHMPAYQKPVEAILAPLADHTIAVSESVRDFCIRQRSIPAERISVVYNGAPLDEFSAAPPEAVAALRREFGLGENETVVGTVARLHPQKGLKYFIEAMPTILSRHPGVRFAIVGDGALRPELEAQAASLGLGDRLLFTGFRGDVPAFLGLFDLMVIPSLYEGTPLTVFEAIVNARPIVATTADGLGEVLTHGRTALLIPPADAGALAEQISAVLADAELRRRLAENCRAERGRFDIQTSVDRMQEIYDDVLLRRRRGRKRG